LAGCCQDFWHHRWQRILWNADRVAGAWIGAWLGGGVAPLTWHSHYDFNC